jgi:hypothetical protein
MTPRPALSPDERRLYSKLRQLLIEPGLLRGSLVEIRRSCGKASCHCQRGGESRHPALYLGLSLEGKQKMVYVPADWQPTVREWVARYGELRSVLEQLAACFLKRLQEREK